MKQFLEDRLGGKKNNEYYEAAYFTCPYVVFHKKMHFRSATHNHCPQYKSALQMQTYRIIMNASNLMRAS